MNCPICQGDKWTNVDEFRHDKKGMEICNGCGFVSYPTLYKTEEEIKEYYRAEYRPAPGVGNLFSGQRKIHYHEFFLRSVFDKWKADKIAPVVGEVGAAYGLVLKWVKNIFPEAEVGGSEMTLSYRRVAFHENDIVLDEEIDLTKKYDLIISYKVQEHLMDPDKKLREMVLALKDDGLMYISVPCWFNTMYNFGAAGFTLSYYYDTNHINVWTRPLFETMMKKCGLEIVKEDHCIYDSTYLCKRNDAMMNEKPVYEDPEEIKDRMRKIKEASIAFDQREYGKAIEIWPNYPSGWQACYENSRGELHKKGFEEIIKEFVDPMLKACPYSATVFSIAADICMRYSKWDQAIELHKKVLEMRPQCPHSLLSMGHCFRNLSAKSPDKKIELLKQARDLVRYTKEISLQSRDECINWIYKDSSNIPLPTEVQGGQI